MHVTQNSTDFYCCMPCYAMPSLQCQPIHICYSPNKFNSKICKIYLKYSLLTRCYEQMWIKFTYFIYERFILWHNLLVSTILLSARSNERLNLLDSFSKIKFNHLFIFCSESIHKKSQLKLWWAIRISLNEGIQKNDLRCHILAERSVFINFFFVGVAIEFDMKNSIVVEIQAIQNTKTLSLSVWLANWVTIVNQTKLNVFRNQRIVLSLQFEYNNPKQMTTTCCVYGMKRVQNLYNFIKNVRRLVWPIGHWIFIKFRSFLPSKSPYSAL